MYTGPHIIKDGLVFGYDTGYGIADNDTATRFYTGEPAVNLWDSLLNTQSLRTHTKHYWNGKKWTEDATYTHPGVDGPKDVYLGLVFKHVSGALNSSWSGTSYGYMLRDIACTNGATMTMSSWIYASSDCNVDSIPAVIEGESGGESTVTGYPASYDLNNKGTWQVTAKKAISDGNTRFIPLYPRKNGVTDGSFAGFFMWALPQVTYGDRVVTPIQPGATRSSTASLIDLKETRNINVSNVSFDSTGQPDFDGTNDYLDLGSDVTFKGNGGDWSAEHIVKYDVVPAGYNNSTSPGNFLGGAVNYNSWYWSVLNSKLALWNRSPGVWKYGSTTLEANKFYHVVLVCEPGGTSYKMYLNGVEEGGTNASYVYNASHSGISARYFGVGSAPSTRVVNGKIPVTRIYEKALSATEIKQNFNAYKNRFDI